MQGSGAVLVQEAFRRQEEGEEEEQAMTLHDLIELALAWLAALILLPIQHYMQVRFGDGA